MASAQKALDDGRIADAVRLARYGAERSESPETLELLGRALLAEASVGPPARRAEARREAAAAYRRAAASAPQRAALQHAAALVLDTAGERHEALLYHDRAIDLEPSSLQMRLHRANLRLRLGDLEGAEEDRTALVALAPGDAWTLALSAELALARGDVEAARHAAAAAQRVDADEPAFRVLLAKALRSSGAPADAIALLSALDLSQRDAATTAELAASWLALERPDRAAEAWERFAGTRPDAIAPLLEAASIRFAAGDLARARAWLDRARLLDPADPSLADLERRFADR